MSPSWTTWPLPSAVKCNFLVLTCIRKFAALCLALDLAVTVRWIPSEANISDRPSRTHDPSVTENYDDTIDLGNKIYPWITKSGSDPGRRLRENLQV